MSLCACGHARDMHNRHGECWGELGGRSCMSSCREYRPFEPMLMSEAREKAISEGAEE